MRIVQSCDESQKSTQPEREPTYADKIGKLFLIDGDVYILVRSYYDPQREAQWVNLTRNSICALHKMDDRFPSGLLPANSHRVQELPNARLVLS